MSLTRRRFQSTLGGVGGLAARPQGWRLRTAAAQSREPRGRLTWAIQATIAPTWFDPAETPGIGMPFMFSYALHDALVKPMPAHPLAPSPAASSPSASIGGRPLWTRCFPWTFSGAEGQQAQELTTYNCGLLPRSNIGHRCIPGRIS